MRHIIRRLPILIQFAVIIGFIFTLALVQNLFNRTGIEKLLTLKQPANGHSNQVQTISLACLFSEELKPNQTLETLLSAKGLPMELIHRLSEPLKKIVNLRQLRPGELLSLWSSPDSSFVLLEYEKSPTEVYQVSKNLEEVNAYSVPVYLDKRVVSATAMIDNSLWEALVAAEKSPELAVKLADIFAWEIDFLTETKPGDKLKFLYEEIWKGEELVGLGDILAAEVVISGNAYRAYLFEDPPGHCDYYDDSGKSLRKAFLKSPLSYRRVSSGFSYSRKHPIFHTSRPHYGVDFAAPYGTPVAVTADGVVRFAGWKGGLGKFVEIRHSNGWVTGYGHLSRIAAGIIPGLRVQQKDLIGYVGSTGWSTGAHLHYQVEIGGRQVNPLKLQAPAGTPVKSEYLAGFQQLRAKFLADLNVLPVIYAQSQN